jgi:hypothetical protein
MSNKINKIAQAIFIYLEDIGPCEVSVHCYDDEIEQVGSFQPTVWFDGQTHNRNDKKVPMVGTFRNFFMEYTEDHMGELTSRVDYDINDYHELVFRIYPEEKKIDIKSYCYFIEYSPFEYKYEETPEHIVEMMDEDNVSWFKVEFWGGNDDYSFRYDEMEGDADPGFVRQFEDYFVKFLDIKNEGWFKETGSEGEFHVNRNTIDLELNLKDEEFRSSGFHKEIKL